MAVYDRIRRLVRQRSGFSIADGWTDDLSVKLRAGSTVEELVDHGIVALKENRPHELLIAGLREQFGLAAEDAELAVDRISGGVFRAVRGNRANCPDRTKDPIAWMAFQRAIAKH